MLGASAWFPWGSRGTSPQFLTTVCIQTNKEESTPMLKNAGCAIFLIIDVQPKAIFEQKKI
jgi:hypothetical protein